MMEQKAIPEIRVLSVRPVQLVQPARREKRVHKEYKVKQVRKDYRVSKEKRVIPGTRVLSV